MIEQLALVPKPDIAFAQRNCPFRSTVSGHCILADSEEVEECHQH